VVLTARQAVMAATLVTLVSPVIWAQRGGGPPAQAPQAARGTGLILGQVVDAATGQPIPDAIVTYMGQGSGRGRGTPSAPAAGLPPPLLRYVTGTDGRFVLRDLPAGQIQIEVTASGYLNGRAGQAHPEGMVRPIVLADGERNGSVRIRLWRHGVISGTITDETGEPAVGAQVRAVKRGGAGGILPFTSSAPGRTDDRGVFRLSTLSPGDYYVIVPQTQSTFPAAVLERLSQAMLGGNPLESLGSFEALEALSSSDGAAMMANPGGITRIDDLIWTSSFAGAPGPRPDGRLISYTPLVYPGATSLAEATPVTVRSGEERSGIDVQLRLVPSSRISGIVTGATGPVANTGVRLLVDDGAFTSTIDVEAATTVTRADGSFLFLGIPPGRYRAVATKRGQNAMSEMLSMLGGGATKPPAPAPSRYARASINAGGADVTGLTLTLREGATVSGRFEFQGTAPKPAPGTLFNVRLVSAGSSAFQSPTTPPDKEPDPSGRFRTPAYAPGFYRLTVNGGNWVPVSAMIDGRDALVEPFELTESDISDVVIIFTDQPVRVTGSVNAGGSPAPTATVIIMPADVSAESSLLTLATRVRVVLADARGAFNVGGLRPGDYLIAAVDDSEAAEPTAPAFLQALARVATRVTLAASENKQALQVVKVPR
jgi:hypothetical protein